jgi:hypothetical protein
MTRKNFELPITSSTTLYFKVAKRRAGVVTVADLTGSILYFRVTVLENAELVFEKSSPDGGIYLNLPEEGKFEVYIDPVDTEGLVNQKTKLLKWVLRLEVESTVKVLQEGTITLTPTN